MMWTMPWFGDPARRRVRRRSRRSFCAGLDLLGGDLVDDVEAVFDAAGGDVVVDRGDGAVGAAELAAGHAEAVEGLRAGDLVDEVQVDVEDRGFACGFGDEVLLPDFFEESFGCCGHGCAFCSVGGRVKVFAPVAALSEPGAVCRRDRRGWRCGSAE